MFKPRVKTLDISSLDLYRRKKKSFMAQQLLTLCNARFTEPYYRDGLSEETKKIMAFFDEVKEILKTYKKKEPRSKNSAEIEKIKLVLENFYRFGDNPKFLFRESDDMTKTMDFLYSIVGFSSPAYPESWKILRSHLQSTVLPEEYDALVTLNTAWDIGLDSIRDPVIFPYVKDKMIDIVDDPLAYYKYQTLALFYQTGLLDLPEFELITNSDRAIAKMRRYDREWHKVVLEMLRALKPYMSLATETRPNTSEENPMEITLQRSTSDVFEKIAPKAIKYAKKFKVTLSDSFLTEIRMFRENKIVPFYMDRGKEVPENIVKRLIFQDPIGFGALLASYRESKKLKTKPDFDQLLSNLIYAPPPNTQTRLSRGDPRRMQDFVDIRG